MRTLLENFTTATFPILYESQKEIFLALHIENLVCSLELKPQNVWDPPLHCSPQKSLTPMPVHTQPVTIYQNYYFTLSRIQGSCDIFLRKGDRDCDYITCIPEFQGDRLLCNLTSLLVPSHRFSDCSALFWL